MNIFLKKILIIFVGVFFAVNNFSFAASKHAKITVPCKKAHISKTVHKPQKVKAAKKKVAKKPVHKAAKNPNGAICHYSFKAKFGKRPALVNILSINLNNPKVAIKVTYGNKKIKNLTTVKDFVKNENAVAGINGSFFKRNSGVPIGLSIIDGQMKTGPMKNRSVFGIDKNNSISIDKVELNGKITFSKGLDYELHNINQPALNLKKPSIFTSDWAKYSPRISENYVNINVVDSKIEKISANPIALGQNNFVVVFPKKLLSEKIEVGADVTFEYKLFPEKWNSMNLAVCGGPCLVKNGKIFIDKQKFTNRFLWAKAPRTAIGYTHNNKVIFVTIDGREKGHSEGATLAELARFMKKLGCIEAMNLDGGSSTQMILNKKIVNYPTIRGGARVTNAIVVKI